MRAALGLGLILVVTQSWSDPVRLESTWGENYTPPVSFPRYEVADPQEALSTSIPMWAICYYTWDDFVYEFVCPPELVTYSDGVARVRALVDEQAAKLRAVYEYYVFANEGYASLPVTFYPLKADRRVGDPTSRLYWEYSGPGYDYVWSSRTQDGVYSGPSIQGVVFTAFSVLGRCPPLLTPLDELNATLSGNDPDTIWQENNPNTPNTARLTPETAQAKLCIDDRIRVLGGTPVLTSAFRTEAYQRHLWEIYDRWIGDKKTRRPGLNENTQPECAELKAKVKAQWDHHGLGGLKTSPAFSAGRHPLGRALDYSRKSTINPLEGRGVNIANDVAAQCSGVTYPLPDVDKGHFER